MKILHTSDWHLGHSFHGYDRREEQEDMLRQMEDIVRAEKPDTLLVCGDVFDVSQPSASVQKMFVRAVLALRAAHPDMSIVITAGNHDSGTRHEIFRTPWQELGVSLIGVIYTEDSFLNHIIEIPGKGYVVAVPYAHERNIPEGFFQGLLDMVASRNTDGLPVVMSAHTTVEGADFTGHEHATEFSVGGIDGVSIGDMGNGYDYLALGHIHRPQFVRSANHKARYSGSPLPVGFDEDCRHTVSIVEIASHGGTPDVREIEIRNPWPVVTLPAEGAVDWERAKKLLEEYPSDEKAYLRLNVEVDDFLPPGANDEARKIVEGKACRLCRINALRKREASSSAKVFSVEEFKEINPVEIARRFVTEDGGNFDSGLEEMLREVMGRV